jgi:DNA-binding NarL/FixJ family response regulator
MIPMLTKSATTSGLTTAPRGTLAEVGRDLASRPYARRGVPARAEPIHVLLVDDHHLVRAGVKLVLRAFSDICVVGEASNGEEALMMSRRLHPDVVVADLDMPKGDGRTLTQDLQRELPEVRILIVSMFTEQEKLLSLLDVGARGYICKSAVERELGDAIRVVAAGDVYVRPSVANELAGLRIALESRRVDAASRLERLSQRERSVLLLTARGYTGREIGEQLGITAKTVDTYKQRIEDKIGISHRSDYVRIALEADVLACAPVPER